MKNLKLIIIFLILVLSSCTQTIQNNGLSEKNIKNFDIKVGKTSKKKLIDYYGPPIFENMFNKNVMYYISHSTGYKAFDKRKTKHLFVLEITLDDNNIVQKIKNYSDKDGLDVEISENQGNRNINMTTFWKDFIRALSRKNTEN